MTTEAEAIARLAEEAVGAKVITTEDGRRFLVTPKGSNSQEITDPHGLKPRRAGYIAQEVTLQTRDSLVEYVNRFKVGASVLFADIDANAIVAVLDYHDKSDGKGVSGQANHAVHRASMKLPYSEEWKLWSGIDGKLVGQLEFARFLEENAADISAPPGADLLECVRDLQALRKVNFTKAVRTSSDNENFEWTDETQAISKNGGVELPTRFELALPVYFGEPITPLYAFLRWKVDGALYLGIKLHRAEHVRQASFKAIVTEIAERTGCPVVYGTPSGLAPTGG